MIFSEHMPDQPFTTAEECDATVADQRVAAGSTYLNLSYLRRMDERIFNKFSCNEWIVVPASVLQHASFGEGKSTGWKDAFLIDNTAEEWWLQHRYDLVVSPEINGYHLVEGQPFSYQEVRRYLFGRLSQQEKLFFFHTDLWVPQLEYFVFRNGLKVRNYAFSVDTETEEEAETDTGTQEAFENETLYLTDKYADEYSYFWFPMRAMAALGISEQDLLDALEKPCTIYQVDATLKKAIDAEAEQAGQ